MIRYRLDDLGWYQFEWIVQSLLKARCGLAIEAWGGQSDWGIDAYSQEALKFPDQELKAGPFLFQVKFIQEANAAGAKSDQALENSVKKEIISIHKRRAKNRWEEPKYYTLLTNAPISALLKKKLRKLLRDALPKVGVILWGGTDICDLLDQYPSIRRSFPQILGLRDLDFLLSEIVNKEILERSRSAIDAARDISSVFVPTSAYNLCWKTLNEHHFAVLEGPPEVGKTAIAWVIAMTLLSQGWEAIVCENPEDFYQSFSSSTAQVFVADDAFGRTEYDPDRGRLWEPQLERIVRKLDTRHWLIWTSRKHILERARRAMDLQGETSNFPQPADILVDVGNLSSKEKALILYRHAKSRNLEAEARELIKRHSVDIVLDTHFTPERIRRFVQDELPELVLADREQSLSDKAIREKIRQAIQTPTSRMKKSFLALDKPLKLLLLAMLEVPDDFDSDHLSTLKKEFECLSPPSDQPIRYDEMLDQLSESFIKVI
jgi:hypothetical protein